jgi:ketosteroid isomerase-like protein
MTNAKSATRSDRPTAAGRVVDDLYSALNERDMSGATDLLAEDVTWTVPDSLPAGGAYRGRAAVTAYLTRLAAAPDPVELQPERYIEEDRHVVVTGQTAMTSSQTGSRDHVPFAHVLTVQNGKVAAFDEFTDTLRVAQLIGSPAAAPSWASDDAR